ncbi:MAG TPA: hypothetical protein VMW50_14000 [Dehalococcoidia bacterium]|nr:hypothetical protein [Dehalococcoidia bacterium]
MSKLDDNTVSFSLRMKYRLFRRIDEHLKELGEGNKSAWIRRAIINQMSHDRQLMEE